MNIFRLAGDMTHLLSIIVLLLKIRATRSARGALGNSRKRERDADLGIPGLALPWQPPLNLLLVAAGISLKTQELYAIVFVCRYLDLFHFFSL